MCTCVGHLCLMCLYMVHVQICGWKPEEDIRCSAPLVPTLFLWDRVSLSLEWGWWLGNPSHSLASIPGCGHRKLSSLMLQLFLFMCLSILPGCKCVYYVRAWCPWRPEEGVGLELELQVLVSCHVGFGNWTWVLCKPASCLNHRATSPAPVLLLLDVFLFRCVYSLELLNSVLLNE